MRALATACHQCPRVLALCPCAAKVCQGRHAAEPAESPSGGHVRSIARNSASSAFQTGPKVVPILPQAVEPHPEKRSEGARMRAPGSTGASGLSPGGALVVLPSILGAGVIDQMHVMHTRRTRVVMQVPRQEQTARCTVFDPLF